MCKFTQKEASQILKIYYYSFITTIKYKYTVFPDVQKVFWLLRIFENPNLNYAVKGSVQNSFNYFIFKAFL